VSRLQDKSHEETRNNPEVRQAATNVSSQYKKHVAKNTTVPPRGMVSDTQPPPTREDAPTDVGESKHDDDRSEESPSKTALIDAALHQLLQQAT